jgi:two-component system, chemotaxis family, chemotaxis protein CheY
VDAVSPQKILIVDDSQTVRQQVTAALSPAGFEVLEAENGLQALECLKTTTIAMVICDVNMPEMDGLELLDVVRSSGLKVVPPIVMLTSEGRADLIERAKKAGAHGWLVKPIKGDQLLAVVRKMTAVR